jgi:hypothetical protein
MFFFEKRTKKLSSNRSTAKVGRASARHFVTNNDANNAQALVTPIGPIAKQIRNALHFPPDRHQAP